MTKDKPRLPKDDEVHINVESWQWESPTSRFTWKHALILALLLAGGLLFAFGFLVIAVLALGVGLILGLVMLLLKKLS